MGLGCFPFDRETYLTQSDSRTHLSGILSLIRVGNLSTPHLFSALPPVNICEASPKAISGRTSYLRARLEFLRYPQVIPAFFNMRLVRSSTVSYHRFNLHMGRSPGFGSIARYYVALFRLGFPSAPVQNTLTSQRTITRRTVLQKVRHRALTRFVCL